MSCGALKLSPTQSVIATLIAVEQVVKGADVIQLDQRPRQRPGASVLDTALRRSNLVESRTVGKLCPLHVFPLCLESVEPLIVLRHTVMWDGAVHRVVCILFFYPKKIKTKNV